MKLCVAEMKWLAVAFLFVHLMGCASTPSTSTSESRRQLEQTGETWVHRPGTPPNVVFQSGLGDGKVVWAELMEVLQDESVFVYDRPGYVSNPAGDTPRDPCTIAAELRAQLRNTGLQPPYILVGHSLGGLYQYAFARRFPTEVAGLVLLDPTHPRHWETLQRELPASASLIKGLRILSFSSTERQEFDTQSDCLETLEPDKALAVPTRVLVSGRFKSVEQGDYVTMLKGLRQDWLRLVPAPRLEVVHDAGHYIQRDSPEEVAVAVQSLLGTLPGQIADSPAASRQRSPGDIVAGQTSQGAIRKKFGEPGEIRRDGDREIWIYNHRLEVPLPIGLIPVVGDLAEALELLWNIANDEELIVQFDSRGIVKKASLRKLD